MRYTRIRKMTPDDYELIGNLYFWEFCGDPYSNEEVVFKLRNNRVYGYVAECIDCDEENKRVLSNPQLVAMCAITNAVDESSCAIEVTPGKYDYEVDVMITHISIRNRGIMSELLQRAVNDVIHDNPHARICCRAFGYHNKPNAKTALELSGFKQVNHYPDVYWDERCPYNEHAMDSDPRCGVHSGICGLHCSMSLYEYHGGSK